MQEDTTADVAITGSIQVVSGDVFGQTASGIYSVGQFIEDDDGQRWRCVQAPRRFVRATVTAAQLAAAVAVTPQSITGSTAQEQVDSVVAALVALGYATDDR